MLSNDERISWSILTGHKNIKLVKLFFTFTKEPPLITIRSKEKKAANPTSAPHGEFGPEVAVPNNFINKVTEISPSTQRNLQERSTQTAVESVVKSIEIKVETSKPNEIMQFNQKFQAADLFVYTDCANFA